MPQTKSAFRRYLIIDRMLRDGSHPFPTINDICAACGKDREEPISISTIEKDIKFLRSDPGIRAPIVFSRQKGGYSYSNPDYSFMKKQLGDDEAEWLAIAMALLKNYQMETGNTSGKVSFNNLSSILEFSEESRPTDIAHYIQFETGGPAKGTEYIKPILKAIRNKQEIEVHYHASSSGTMGAAVIRPVLLKQYQRRWYVLSFGRKGYYSVYALDRMEGDIRITGNRFKTETAIKASDFFKDVIGVTVFDEKPSKVVLSFTPWQSMYVKSLPLHSTQTVLIDNNKEYRIQLNVQINYELITEILRHRAGVKIISPRELKNRVKKELKLLLS
jgi:predicted DNA-binding transcriptional regulator YafY